MDMNGYKAVRERKGVLVSVCTPKRTGFQREYVPGVPTSYQHGSKGFFFENLECAHSFAVGFPNPKGIRIYRCRATNVEDVSLRATLYKANMVRYWARYHRDMTLQSGNLVHVPFGTKLAETITIIEEVEG